jgi:hypothetical protein
VQLRTLSMDRELLEEKVGFPPERGVGMQAFIETMRRRVPDVELGSHTPYVGRARVHVY